ncbi:MAG: hypothetical protein IJ822_06135 [Pyramidobacter sp.]|nr:hypothetical protein [Pyramidobacter sp.]
MYDPFLNHDEISKPQSWPCLAGEGHEHGHEHEHAHGRGRIHHEHAHEHGEHVHDGRPHVHLPDGTVRYLEEGELPSAPKRRRSPSQEQA